VPFSLSDADKQQAIEDLMTYSYFFATRDDAQIWNFHENISSIVEKLSVALGYNLDQENILFADYVKAALKQPQLFALHPDTIMRSVVQLWDIADRLSERSLEFPRAKKDEEALATKQLVVKRMLSSPHFFNHSSDRILRAEIALEHQLDPLATKGKVSMDAITGSAKKKIEGLFEQLMVADGEPIECAHPDPKDSDLKTWTKAHKDNFAARILAQVGRGDDKLFPGLVAR